MSYDKEKLINMSGENKGNTPKLVLNKVKLNGKDGIFKKTLLTKPKNDKDRYDIEDLGDNINVIFLKIRRYLVKETNDGVMLQSSEHNSPDNMITLYNKEAQDTSGKATDLREKFPELRTIQVIYALLLTNNGAELIRLIAKGSSLGSKNKPEDSIPFYDYLTSFNRTGENPEHSFEYITKIISKSEKGPVGDYFAMSFEKGEKLSDDKMEKVSSEMAKVFEFTEEYDEYIKEKVGVPEIKKTETVTDIKKDDIDTIEYPTAEDENINPEDIPF